MVPRLAEPHLLLGQGHASCKARRYTSKKECIYSYIYIYLISISLSLSVYMAPRLAEPHLLLG